MRYFIGWEKGGKARRDFEENSRFGGGFPFDDLTAPRLAINEILMPAK